MWRHPKYYKDLRKLARLRNRDEAISDNDPTGSRERAPRTGQSGKQQAIEETVPHIDIQEAASDERQATSTSKPQATSKGKLQATSSKRQASE